MRKAIVAALAAVIPLTYFAAGPASATDTGLVTQMTSGNDKSTVPVISGDGDTVVFHSEATNLPGVTKTNANIDDVFTADISGASPSYDEWSDGDSGERASFPDISSNGQWAVFSRSTVSAPTAQIVRVRLSDGLETVITAGNDDSGSLFNTPGARVADNGHVVFQSLATNLVGGDANDTVTDIGGNVIEGWDVYYWNGSTITKLSDESAPNFVYPDVAADASIVAYESTAAFSASAKGGSRQVYSNNTAGSAQTLIAGGNGNDELPQISDDGSKIVFRSDSTDLAGNDSTADILMWTSSGIAAVTDVSGTSGITNAAISGDGNYAVFQYNDQIHRIGTDGSGLIQLSDFSGPSGFIAYPSSSSDGSRVVFAQAVSTTIESIQIMVWNDEVPAGAPDAPTGVTAAATGSDSASVSFTAPADNGSTITSYRVTSTPGGVTADGTSSPIAISGLDASTTYTFTVVAENGVGPGPLSSPSNQITTSEPPCGPILTGKYSGMSGTDGRIARLYAAYFLRNPDSGGFAFWQEKIAAGEWTNDDAATFFSESAEFKELYGANLSNAQFIDLLYENVLCRTADAGGRAFWLNRMDNEGWTRGQVALGFSDSPEFKGRTGTS